MSKRYPNGGFITASYNPVLIPGAPTIGAVTAGDTQVSVAFTAPTDIGGSAITSYQAVSTPGGFTATGSASPLTVTGLSNGTAYTFRVAAINSYGAGTLSAASASVTPVVPFPSPFAQFVGASNTHFSVPPQAFTLGTSPFTVEFFVYMPSNTNGYDQFIGQWNPNRFQFSNLTGNGDGLAIQLQSNAISGPSMTNFLVNQWNFLAYTYDGSTYRLYINGTRFTMTGTPATISPDLGTNVGVGKVITQNGFGITGRMAYLRVTKNVARYTGATMTVPTAPYPTGGSDPNWANVSLLMPMAGSAVDLSSNAYTIINNGVTFGTGP